MTTATKTGYHPEMGEAPRASALFRVQTCLSKMSICWNIDRDAEARQAFRAARCRPSHIKRMEIIGGGEKYSALITFAAYEKLDNTDWEMLLD